MCEFYQGQAYPPVVGKIEQLTTNPIPAGNFDVTPPGEIERLKARIKELEDGIRKHHADFPDEPLQGEVDLWKLVNIEVFSDKHGRYKEIPVRE